MQKNTARLCRCTQNRKHSLRLMNKIFEKTAIRITPFFVCLQRTNPYLHMKHYLSFCLIFLTCIAASAQAYERLEARINDHYNHSEWKETIAIADKMTRIRPFDVNPYSAALVAAQYLDDIDTENRYLELSQRNRIPIDTLLQSVYHRTKLMHNAKAYEAILLNLKANNAWLAKVFNHYLLEYYAFARQTEKTIAIADELLHVTPNNIRYTKIKANALFYQGDEKPAVTLYEKVLNSDSTDYETLTFLSAYYGQQARHALNSTDSLYIKDPAPVDSTYLSTKQQIIDTSVAKAVDYMKRAQSIRRSEYLEQQITEMSCMKPVLPNHPTRKRSLLFKLKEKLNETPKAETKPL